MVRPEKSIATAANVMLMELQVRTNTGEQRRKTTGRRCRRSVESRCWFAVCLVVVVSFHLICCAAGSPASKKSAGGRKIRGGGGVVVGDGYDDEKDRVSQKNKNEDAEKKQETNGEVRLQRAKERMRTLEANTAATFEFDYQNLHFDDGEKAGAGWRTSSSALGELCDQLTEELKLAHREPRTSRTKQVIAAVELTMAAVAEKVGGYEGRPIKKTPWPHNWYQFSVTLPNMLIHYALLDHEGVSMRKSAASLVLRLVESPRMSLGYERDAVNSCLMFGAWAMARHILRLDDAKLRTETKYVASVLRLEPVTAPNALGAHLDGGYISHATIYGWGYLEALWSPYTEYAYAAYPELVTRLRVVRAKVHRLLGHATVAREMPGLWGRTETISTRTIVYSPHGVRVVPSMRFLRFNTANARFSARGIFAGFGYYEADKGNFRYSQLWTQYRAPLLADLDHLPPYSRAYGVIGEKTADDYVAVRSQTTTTQVFYPSKGSFAFVAFHEDVAVLAQSYSIPEYGAYLVEELVVADEQRKIVQVHRRVKNDDPTRVYSMLGSTVEYVTSRLPQLEKFDVAPGRSVYFVIVMNLSSGSVVTKLPTDDGSSVFKPNGLWSTDQTAFVMDVKRGIFQRNNASIMCAPGRESRSYKYVDGGEENQAPSVYEFVDEPVNQWMLKTT